MKEKIVGLMMLMLILTSMSGMMSIVGPSLAESSKNGVSSKGGVGAEQSQTANTGNRIFEARPDAKQENPKDPSQTSTYDGSKWDFNDTSQWGNYTYLNGNKTRLVVGVDDRKSISLAELERTAVEHQAKIVNTVTIGGHVRAVVVEVPLVSVTGFVEEVHVAGLASYVEPNMKVEAQFVPNDPYWSFQWGPQKIGADWAWNTTVGNSSILVAVVDTGIDYNHPDLVANYAPLGYDWVNNDPDPRDDYGHGTHCAGIVAAGLNNSVGIAGLAQVQIMSEKVLDQYGSGYDDWVANGIAHATDMGAKIISMSLGGYGDSELIHDAVKYAYEHGVLLVAAAGNDNTNMKSYPAAYDEVVAVAATDMYDNKASFSNWGDWIELAAPGDWVYSTMPTYHVTLNDYGYAMNYDYLSGTSMACPHVSGAAALAWSRYPNRTRDWVRLWLRDTAYDLGDPGFDASYGYGRVDVRKAVEQTPPAHELIAYEWETPPYVKPGTSGIVNVTVLNFGENDETSVEVRLLANDSVVNSTSIGSLASGHSTTVSLTWNPTAEGLYNVTSYIVPVQGETNTENNGFSKYIYVGSPVIAVVLHSAGNIDGDIITNWQELTSDWHLFGDTMVYIDYTTLNKENIAYEDIAATEADVLIISCAYDRYAGWQFTDSEIEAIKRYVYEGHGLIATAGTLYMDVPNNNKLAPLFGIKEAIVWDSTDTDLLHLLNTTHPLFDKVPNPLVIPAVGTALPSDGRWDSSELAGGKYLALGHNQESAIVAYKGLVYISPWLEVIPPYYHHHLQLLYNAITWSRYVKPQHELGVSLEVPQAVKPGKSALLNATVSNMGLSDETVELQLSINGLTVNSTSISELPAGDSYTLSHLWTPTNEGVYNITAYALPVPGEDDITNNVKSSEVFVSLLSIALFQNWNPWDYAANQEALDQYGVPYVIFSSSDIGTVDLSEFAKVVIASDQDQPFYNAMNAYRWWFESYASKGGILEIHAADWGWHGGGWTGSLPGGLEWTSYYGQQVSVVDPAHPLLNSPNVITGAELDNWNSAVHGYFSVYPPDAHIVIIEDSSRMPAYLEFTYGAGSIIASSQTLEWAYSHRFSLILENSLLYAPKRYEHDIAVSLESPSFVEPGGSTLLNVTVLNKGLNNETDVELYLLINEISVCNTTIDELQVGDSRTITYLWTPTFEGRYNVTGYAPPLLQEEFVGNNNATRIVSVKPITHVLFDQTHGTDSITYYSTWVTSLINGGCVVETHYSGPITSDVLANHDVFVIPQAYSTYSPDELSAIQAFVFNGGGLLVIGDDEPYIYTDLTSFAGITWTSGGVSGNTTDITPHPVTVGVTCVYLDGPVACMNVAGVAQDLVRDAAHSIMLAVSEQPSGKVLGFADENSLWDSAIVQADNLLLANNMIDWLAIPIRQEHDIGVSLESPASVELGNSTFLIATAMNRGLNIETDVELYLLINGAAVSSATHLTLSVGELYAVNFAWTPLEAGTYNVTAYAPPVPGEEYAANNNRTRLIGVFYYKRLYLPHEWISGEIGGIYMNWHADDNSWEYTLPFDFPFYGNYYETIYISSNGLITFLQPDASYSNSIDALAQKLAMAPAWDDWDTNDPYDIYTWQNSTHVGIRWYVAAHYDMNIVAYFEVILSSEGVIQFDYEYNNGVISATAGISNGAGHILAEDLTDLNGINTIVFTPFPGEHDVAVIGVESSSSKVTAGEPVNVSVVARNQGTFTENFTVTAYASPQTNPAAAIHAANLSSPSLSIINPGPDGKPARWTTGPPRYPGSSEFLFYSNETTVDSTFFVNVTISDVTNMKTWGIGLVYDSTALQFVSAWRPTDHVFSPLEDMGVSMVAPAVVVVPVDATHQEVQWGCAYIMPDPPWAFNGTGQLCQIQFKIIKGVNVANPEATALFAFDPDWTQVYYNPSGMEVPTLGTARYEYYYYLTPPVPAGYVIGTAAVTNLIPGQNTTLTFAWNTTDVPAGNYVIGAEASDVLYEENRGNNALTDGEITIVSGNVHDVAVTDVQVSSNIVYQGWVTGISATVANLGNATETFTVALYCDSNVIATQSVQNLAPNATSTLYFVWNTSNVPPCHSYTIEAVAGTVPGETNTTNNVLFDGSVRVRIRGDVIGDDVVNMDDIVRMLNAFGSFSDDIHHFRWNSLADFNQDGKVDMSDIVETLVNFGRSS